MIRRLFVCASLFVSLHASAATPVSFSFAAVPVLQFAQATYRDLLGRDFVLSDQVIALGKKVTVSVKELDASKLPEFVDRVLAQQGIRSTLRDGVYFLDVVGPADVDAAASTTAPAVPATNRGIAPGEHRAPLVASTANSDVGQLPPVDVKVKLVQVMNRPVDLVVAAVNAAFGSAFAKPAGGPRIVIAAPKDKLDDVVDLVEQLDEAVPSVEVSASFVEVTRSDGASSALSLVSRALSTTPGLNVVPAQGTLSIGGGRYDLVLQALASDGRFKQVSNGRVVGDDAEKLLLSVGDETPTVASSTTTSAGNPIQNITYRPSGVILDVLPHVLGSGRLSLVVDGQVSAFQATTTGVTGSPTLVKRQVKTTVTIGDGDVLVIGGLNDAKETGTTAGFSFLPAKWRTFATQNAKTDLVLILSARVTKSATGKAL